MSKTIISLTIKNEVRIAHLFEDEFDFNRMKEDVNYIQEAKQKLNTLKENIKHQVGLIEDAIIKNEENHLKKIIGE